MRFRSRPRDQDGAVRQQRGVVNYLCYRHGSGGAELACSGFIQLGRGGYAGIYSPWIPADNEDKPVRQKNGPGARPASGGHRAREAELARGRVVQFGRGVARTSCEQNAAIREQRSRKPAVAFPHISCGREFTCNRVIQLSGLDVARFLGTSGDEHTAVLQQCGRGLITGSRHRSSEMAQWLGVTSRVRLGVDVGTAVGEGPTAIDAVGVTVGLGAIVGVAAIVGVTMGDVGVSLGAGEGVADGDAVVVGTGVAEVTQPETAMAIRSPVSRGPVACNFVRRWRLLVCRSKETRPSLIHRALSNGPRNSRQ